MAGERLKKRVWTKRSPQLQAWFESVQRNRMPHFGWKNAIGVTFDATTRAGKKKKKKQKKRKRKKKR